MHGASRGPAPGRQGYPSPRSFRSMQPAAAPASPEIPSWAYVVAGLVGVFSVLFFFQTRDPMILIFGLMSAGMLFGVVWLVSASRGGALGGRVMVRCPSCRGLNAEDARFCSQCGKAM